MGVHDSQIGLHSDARRGAPHLAALRHAGSRPGRAFVVLAALSLTACAVLPWHADNPAADRAQAAAVVSAVDDEALEQATELEPTRALQLDGDQRIAEPAQPSARRLGAQAVETGVMPLVQRYHPRVAPIANGSVSVGTVTAGYLVDGVEVPVDGEHHHVLDRVAPRQTRYTTDDMRDLLLCAAERVAKAHRGAVLGIGNMSRMGGGPLPWSVSHHNGRDADIGFYVRDSAGKLTVADRLYHFDARGKATDSDQALTFDAEVNWSLVAALLECKGPELQHLFVADWLKTKMLAAAVKKKADKKLILRAAALMHQPKKTLAHNDHLHLRIGCGQDDRSEGCVDASRASQAAWGNPQGVRQRLPAIRANLHADDPELRAGAVYLLALYRDDQSWRGIATALGDRDSRVRLQAVRALVDWGGDRATGMLESRLSQESEPRVALAILHGLLSLQDLPGLAQATRDRRRMVPADSAPDVPVVVVRRLAAALLAEAATLDVAPALVELLDDSDSGVRDTARRSLGRLTNHETTDVVALAGPTMPGFNPSQPLEPVQEKALWRAFLDSLPRDVDRQDVALAGLARHGVEVRAVERSQLPQLVQALAMPSPWRDNAARWISQVVAYKPPVGRGAQAAPLAFWSTWLVQRHLISGAEVAARLAAAALIPGENSVGGTIAAGAAADAD